MVEMDPLERQVADVARRVVGPPRPFDALAIARASVAGTAATTRRSVLGALRFLAAGAVVALFGGLLLVGFSATPIEDTSLPGVAASAEPTASPAAEPTTSASMSPERSTRTDVLPGVSVVTEEVEPGVLRIVSDGVRELARPTGLEDYDVHDSTIAAGRDGSVWIFDAQRFFRLGEEAEHAWKGARFIRHVAPSVAPDGRLWLLDGEVLRVFDGGRWKVERRRTYGFDMWPDGTMWTKDRFGDLLRGDVATWTNVGAETAHRRRVEPRYHPDQIWVSPRIDEFFARDLEAPDAIFEVLERGRWHSNGLGVELIRPDEPPNGGPAGAVDADLRHVDMDDAGDWWIYQFLEVPIDATRTRTVRYLVHVHGGTSGLVYTDEDGVPETNHSDWGGLMEAAPGGRVWMTASVGSSRECGGAASFDGETWRHVLSGVCFYDLDVAPDGSVWLQGATGGYMADAVETYVIRPEDAMADG